MRAGATSVMLKNSMRKILLPTCVIISALIGWYFTFSIFYESWVPYYYEDYLSHIYIGISLVLVVSPLFLAHYKFKEDSKIGYYRAYTWFGLFVVLLFIGITVYMFSTGFLFNNGPGVYKVGNA